MLPSCSISALSAALTPPPADPPSPRPPRADQAGVAREFLQSLVSAHRVQVEPAVVADQASLDSLPALLPQALRPPHSQPSRQEHANDISVINHLLPPGQPQPSPSQVQVVHLGRGKKWQVEEDERLCQAWLKVSSGQDANFDGETFWNRVSEEFLRGSSDSKRPPRSIQQRWAKLQQSITQFGECFEEQQSRLPEGTATEAILVEALKTYKLRTEQNFNHYPCWSLLRQTTQWVDHLTKPKMISILPSQQPQAAPTTAVQKRRSIDPSLSDETHANSGKRPKVSEESSSDDHQLWLFRQKMLGLREKKILAIQELSETIRSKVKALEDYNRLESESNQIAIMCSIKTPESENWLKLKQQQILTDLMQKP